MDQKTALKILKEGRNTFITGSAGAGKTYVLNEFIDWCNEENKFLAVTASTGIAATHLGGQTIHSFSGIGIHNDVSELNDMFFDKWAFKKFKAPDIRLCDVLIIDEISMLSAEQFEMIDYVFRKVRRKTGAFGGVQVVVCGDFFQLPPIGRNGQKPQFATESSAWEESDFAICYLTEQHRQNDDDYNRFRKLHSARVFNNTDYIINNNRYY
ncbi:MAG: AAA family ATPase [Candidatus Ancillula sp.]|jgi:ATP-dependent exoDNAse (exonuclease V) alpha subunit|nr:AAA family ATPase [Candidatus Ancillula sp.]